VATKETTSEWTLWVVAVSCALHVAEEYLTGWQDWARETLSIVMPTPRFLFANTVLVIAALLVARVGWRRPTLSLVIPSATLVTPSSFTYSRPSCRAGCAGHLHCDASLCAVLVVGVDRSRA